MKTIYIDVLSAVGDKILFRINKKKKDFHKFFVILTFWHRRFTFNSNKSPTWCNSFSVYYPDVCLQLNMFRAFSRPSSWAQWLQWQPLVLPSYRGDSRAVFVVGLKVKPEAATAVISSWWWAGKRPKHVELYANVRIIKWKIVASG
jgi:hypothetical protein